MAARPALASIFPPAKAVKRLLFDVDSRLSYAKLYPVYEQAYASLCSRAAFLLPLYASADDLMVMKEVLSTIRRRTRTANTHLVALEQELVEQAAAHGANDAVAMLAFDAIRPDSTASESDRAHAKQLVAQLFEAKNPLTFKLAGDQALRRKDAARAMEYYRQFLALESDLHLLGEVYKALGHLQFLEPDLEQAALLFEQAVRLGEPQLVAQPHYYLAQLYQHDPERARHHYQLAAGQGLREAIGPLGMMELNVFNRPEIAMEWFRLGMEVLDPLLLLGAFDSLVRLDDWTTAAKAWTTIKTAAEKDPRLGQTVAEFRQTRQGPIARAEQTRA